MQAAGQLMHKFVVLIIDPLILVIFTAGFFLFVFGLVEFLWNLNSGGDNKEGKLHMVWGIVGMLIMISVYGILALIDNTFGLGALNGGTPDMSRMNNIRLPTNFFGD